jgi:hypothetical protein
MAPADNLHVLTFRDVPLFVACLSCGHGSLMEADHLKGLGDDLNDMMLIRAIEPRLRCGQCKTKDVKTLMPLTRREAKRFKEGVRI